MTTGSLRVGVEHELRIWSASTQLDFRQLLPAVAGGLRALDPGDPRARRLPSGLVLTADGREAELVTPPVPWDASAPGKVDDMLAAERVELAARVTELAGADRLTGFSTHVNLTVPDERVVDVGLRFAQECGLATVLVAEPASSAGLLVRPRRGRLEIGGEYAEGEHLVALVTFVGAAVSALLAGDPPPHRLPTPTIVPAREKFGWFLPPEGPYADLLKRGRAADGDQLTVTWEWARPWCIHRGVDPGPVDRLVAGAPLRLEDRQTRPDACVLRTAAHPSIDIAPTTGPRHLFGDVKAETLWLTWHHVVWLLSDERRSIHAVLPVEEEQEFLSRLDAGEYDELVRREMGRRLRRRRLLVHAQLDDDMWWHEVRPGALVPAERTRDGAVPRVSRSRAARQHRAARI